MVFSLYTCLVAGILLVTITGKAQTNSLAGPVIMISHPYPEKMQYNDEARTWYTAHRDTTAVFVRLQITDAVQQKKILQNGLELWVDIKGRKNKKTGITFPIPAKRATTMQVQWTPSGEENVPATNDRNATDVLIKQMSVQREMQLTGFAEELNGRQNCTHPSGIYATLNIHGDTLIYKAVIPYRVLPAQPEAGSTISIGVVEKGIPFTGGMTGGDGPMMGDGPPPGPPSGGSDSMMQMMEDNVFWYKIKPVIK